MRKLILTSFLSFFTLAVAFGQASNGKILFVIDSIPVLQDPEYWNQLNEDDIAEIIVVKDKDELKRLGRSDLDGITYIFTKSYRSRPDSIKKIPSLKQMNSVDGLWNLNGHPYTGRYIDYYNSGRVQNEGYLLKGKLNGQLTVYFKNGMKQSVSNYKNGIAHGFRHQYYKNGALMESKEFVFGKDICGSKNYFINGQVNYELRCGKMNEGNTFFSYYSSGRLKNMSVIGDKQAIRTKKDEKLAYYNTMFLQALNSGDLKKANQHFYQIWLADSASEESKFKEGWLMLLEGRYDEAIIRFDRALAIEPFMREALLFRGIARIKKYRAIPEHSSSNNPVEIPITLEDLQKIPADELEKVCADLGKADEIDPSDLYVAKYVTEAVLKFCKK